MKTLTQEQIDSLNAVYAKMNDDSLVLEVKHGQCNAWEETGHNASNTDRLVYILRGDNQYRIKEKKKVIYNEINGVKFPVFHTISAIRHGDIVVLSLLHKDEKDAKFCLEKIVAVLNKQVIVEE